MERLTVLTGDCRDSLKSLPAECVQCCVTSPPYWGLRDYGHDGQIGLEPTPEQYVERMVDVFREVRRVLRDDGTLWLNLGDSYNGSQQTGGTNSISGNGQSQPHGGLMKKTPNLKPKDLVGIPWRVAFALQADGWCLRQDIIWSKPNPMPESVTDRCTKSHEYLFLLSKSARYFYDAEAVKESSEYAGTVTFGGPAKIARCVDGRDPSGNEKTTERRDNYVTRNRRSVWTVATAPYKEAHFATYPPRLIEPCILAGTSEKGCCATCGTAWERVVDREFVTMGAKWAPNKGNRAAIGDVSAKSVFITGGLNATSTTGWQPTCQCNAGEPVPCVVLDPFGGSGTTAGVAIAHRRRAILCELNPDYVAMQPKRVAAIVREVRGYRRGLKAAEKPSTKQKSMFELS